MKVTFAWWLNIAGLVVGMIAALLMFYFPPRIQAYTEKGEGSITFVSIPTEAGKRRGKRQVFLAKAAPIVLGLSFALQLFAAWLAILN
jgi:hypothetical protein